jgi:hypothetical protein
MYSSPVIKIECKAVSRKYILNPGNEIRNTLRPILVPLQAKHGLHGWIRAPEWRNLNLILRSFNLT